MLRIYLYPRSVAVDEYAMVLHPVSDEEWQEIEWSLHGLADEFGLFEWRVQTIIETNRRPTAIIANWLRYSLTFAAVCGQ